MFLHVTKAEHIADYRIWLEFNDGSRGEVDLREELSGEIFSPLRNLEAFKTFVLNEDLDTIAWPNGADFAPEYLRDLLREKSVAA